MKRNGYKVLLGWILIFWLFIPSGEVWADIAPPAPPQGSGITPDSETTSVRMQAEKVVMEVSAKSSHPTGDATITADFQMHNLGQAEEKMNVRFPLCNVTMPGSTDQLNYLPQNYKYPPIDQFSASVNGTPVRVFNTPYRPGDIPSWDQTPHDENAPCWANFPVVFPPGQDVQIEVRYHQIGYGGYEHGIILNYVKFTYILFSGSAWKDTIGSADVIVRLPMEANDITVYEHPQDAVMSGQEVRWHAQDFEPDGEKGSVTVGILQPADWIAIQKELQNVATNAKDGEAWGRLGKAYKAAVLMEHGWRSDPAGLDLLQKSIDAYQHALELLPKDADWHYGFADLICSDVEWNAFNTENRPQQMHYNQMCIDQLNLALKLNPKQPQALALLQTMQEMNLLKPSASGLDTLLLTPQSTSVPETTETILPPVVAATIEPAPAGTKTKSPSLAPTAVKTPARTPTPVSKLPLCGGFFALGIILLVLAGWHFINTHFKL
jgi:tetratricopeptide (TPR) repeat protein